MEVLKNVEERYLRYDFTAVEINDLSMKLANKVQDKSRIEDEKKSIVSQYKSQVLKIRLMQGTDMEIANKFNVSRRCIGFIKQRKRWAHI